MARVGLLLVLLAVTACGFQLRGSYAIDDALQPLHVSASGDFATALERSLDSGGVTLAATAEEAASTLHIRDTGRERRVLALRDDGRVDEYGLVFRISWSLEGRDAAGEGVRLIEPTRYGARRSYLFDPTNRLAADDEEEMLIATLHRELADRILRRLEAWSPE